MAEFFATPAAWRAWLEKHHATKRELVVGFYKVGSGRKSITWQEAVDEALCFGWIDGKRKSIDAESYENRFTPRRPTSNWSAVNIRRMKQLIREGRVAEAGRRAFALRGKSAEARYSYENRDAARFSGTQAREFRANAKAWSFFQSQPPGYRHIATWWVVSAKQDATQARRLKTLIRDSAHGRRIGLLQRPERAQT